MERLTLLNRKRGTIKAKVSRLETAVENSEEFDAAQIESKLISAASIATGISQCRDEFFEIIDEADVEYTERDFLDLEDRLENVKLKLQRRLNSMKNRFSNSDNGESKKERKVKLPDIQLPRFAGAYDEWSSFKKQFLAVIGADAEISDEQKLLYLLSALQDDAKRVQTTDDTFDSILEALEKRYENKRLIVDTHINALLAFRRMESESSKDLNRLVDELYRHLRALKLLGLDTDKLSEALLMNIVLQKVDKETRKLYEMSLTSTQLPDWKEFLDFLQKRCKVLENVNRGCFLSAPKAKAMKPFSGFKNLLAKETRTGNCPVCKGNHCIYKCEVFLNMTVPERYELVKEKRLCYNCLSSHLVAGCKSRTCRCGRKHHSLLHKQTADKEVKPSDSGDRTRKSEIPVSETYVSPSEISQAKYAVPACLYSESKKQVLLATVMVKIQDARGEFQRCRAMLDSGSQSNFMTVECASRLGLKRERVFTPISGLSGSLSYVKKKVSVIMSDLRDHMKFNTDCLLVPKVTDVIPACPIDISRIKFPNNVNFADCSFHKPGRVDVLLGAELFYQCILPEQRRLESSNLLLQDTVFGYIVTGSVLQRSETVSQCHLTTEVHLLEEQLKRFWEIEELNSAVSYLDSEETFCEQNFINTHYRNKEGRYVVYMPFKEDYQLGESKHVAERRLESLWKRLDKDSTMKQLYTDFMAEYADLGHMTETDTEQTSSSYYFPHHGVYKPEKSTTKLRVVFNASSASTNGVSLNDVMLKGSKLQEDLFSILTRFRSYKYAFTADIEKMYRQILVGESQRNMQRIVWKESSQSTVKMYQLNTVTYGTTCAPFLATRVLLQLARDEKQRFPMASTCLLSDFYMDDVLTGAADLESAKKLQYELTESLQSCGMNLRKWCVNHKDLKPEVSECGSKYYVHEDTDSNVKTLGLNWHPNEDCFTFQVSQSVSSCTKQSVLSCIARIFDPLGLIGPVITKGKVFMQKLWFLKINWHEHLPKEQADEWLKFICELPLIECVKIGRFIYGDKFNCLELHGFADASQIAYGAAVYLKGKNESGEIVVNLVCSKSRVAPLKTLTIPRLELCAALLLSRLVVKVIKALRSSFSKITLYSDSTIALAWIGTSPHKLKTFVANRVSAIQEITELYSWCHVPSHQNPADIISRTATPNELLHNSLWWQGPAFLKESENFTMDEESYPQGEEYYHEMKVPPTLNHSVQIKETFFEEFVHRYSQYLKLIRVLSYILRFTHNVRNGSSQKTGPLTCEEIACARNVLVRHVQMTEFKTEISDLRKSRPVSANSQLRSLNPFLDNDGLLRVGGRLRNTDLKFDTKHPLILPPNHRFTFLLFEHCHRQNFHVSSQSLLNTVRQSFWTVRGRNVARKVVHDCVICFRAQPRDFAQIMGDLPKDRVNPSGPFNTTGVDFCGPFFIKYKGQRSGVYHKVYVSIFVCFATKAVHLELVSDLTAEAFLACLKRFFGRRGKCAVLASDNATNFVGAQSELKRLHKLVSGPNTNVSDYLASEGISWKFIPPRSPNFGGLWEAGVKSFKYHLKRAVGLTKLTYEEMHTIVTQIEGILNSRPIAPLSEDPNDLDVLTPGHFLIGRPISSLPEPELVTVQDNRLDRWQRITKFVQLIWKRWSRDYLCTLQQRYKWCFEKNDAKVGDLVLLKDDNLPPCKWVRGRIEELFSGPDGKVRVVSVNTKNGSFKRGVNKLCILPVKN